MDTLTILQLTLLTFSLQKFLTCVPATPVEYQKDENKYALLYKEYRPDVQETSLIASGPVSSAISWDSERFHTELVRNMNRDIKFKNDEKTGVDRYMSKKCKRSLDRLALLVMNQWPGVKVRVLEGWDEDGEHETGSLHYEGRAVDINTSDRDKLKLATLGQLAYTSGFDWVFYESKHYIHASVRTDSQGPLGFLAGIEEAQEMPYGCFSLETVVNLEDGGRKSMKELNVGDRVLVSKSDGTLYYDKIITFLDHELTKTTEFIRITTATTSLTLTPLHLLFISHQTAPIHAKNVTIKDALYIYKDGKLTLEPVLDINWMLQRGYTAPLTMSGTIIASNVQASCYAVVSGHWLAHAVMWPIRWLDGIKMSDRLFDMQHTGVHWYGNFLWQLGNLVLNLA